MMTKISPANYSATAQHIMVVDDEFHVGLFIEVLLSGKGYTVSHFVDSREALTRFTAQPWLFDLVITDQNMPNMSGIELSKSILTIRPDLPVILCSGFDSEDIKAETTDIAIRSYLSKPFQINELLKNIEENLSVKLV